MKGFAAVLLVVLCVSLMTATPGKAISCGEVQGSLYPCLQYLTGGSGPSYECCSGVTNLRNSLQSQQDRQTACNCMKSAASSMSIRPDAASNLPGKCGVSIGVTVSPSIDCSSIS